MFAFAAFACSLLGPAAAALGNEWEGSILAYEQQDLLAAPPANAIVVTGSSTIADWYWMRNDLAPLEVIPRGFGGSTADDLDYYLERVVLVYAPRAVVIYEGDNDIGSGLTPQYVASRISQIAARISTRYPSTRVYVISIKPSPLRWGVWPQMQQANQLLANFCATDPRYAFIDTATALLGPDGYPIAEYYASDTLHLSAAGYPVWADVVRRVLLAGEQGSIIQTGLQGQDIGSVSLTGSYGASGGVYTLRSGGLDISGTADAFRYAWRSLTGDGQITARVVSQSNAGSWAKAGVMLREQLTAGSRHASVFVTQAAGAFMQYRTATGGSSGSTSSAQPGIAAPYWVRLIRQGNVVRGYLSANGIGWTEVSNVTFSSLPSTIYVGLAASNYSTSGLATVLFDNVAVTAAGSSPPPVVDVTPPTVPTGLAAAAVGSNQVNLTWNASSDSGTGVAGYRIFRNGVAVGTSTTTSYANGGLSANTLYTYSVSAFDAATPANESAQSGSVSATTPAASAYQSQDIGAVSAAGSFSESGGVYTLRSGGLDIWGTADAFRYAWQSLTGDGQITARVVSQSNAGSWAKAGVMLREQLTAGSRHAFVFVTQAAGAFMQYRTATGGSTGPGSGEQPGIAAPYWVRLIRQGNVVTGYISPNGTSWTQRGSVTFSSLPSTIYVGLAASNYSTSGLATVLFDNVAVTAAGSTAAGGGRHATDGADRARGGGRRLEPGQPDLERLERQRHRGGGLPHLPQRGGRGHLDHDELRQWWPECQHALHLQRERV